MSKFSFFNPTNGSKSEGERDKITEQIQPQVTSGSPEGAPEERTGDKNKKQNVMQVVDKKIPRGVEAGGLEPPTR